MNFSYKSQGIPKFFGVSNTVLSSQIPDMTYNVFGGTLSLALSI